MISYRTDNVLLYQADCLAALKTLPDNSIDSCVTDPPYGLNFMNKDWDKFLPDPAIWTELLRVLKPGAHACVMGAPRTYHRLACAIEDAGFEIRDCISWMYGSGFPKSHNVALGIDKYFGHENRGRAIPTASTYQACDEEQEDKLTSNPVEAYTARTDEAKAWEGWGTALKPAYEPIALCRKPLEGTVAENVLGYGVGGLNIDECRVGSPIPHKQDGLHRGSGDTVGSFAGVDRADTAPKGRWPANVIHDGSEEVLACFPNAPGQLGPSGGASKGYGGYGPRPGYKYDGPPSDNVSVGGGQINCFYNDTGSAARFFYCAKASKAEREAGLDKMPGVPQHLITNRKEGSAGQSHPRAGITGNRPRKNTHPTVKPLALIEYLVTLITPPGGVVLDPFVGSGTTILAALNKGFRCIAVEREEEYIKEIIIPKLKARNI